MRFELADQQDLRWKMDFAILSGRRFRPPLWMVLSDGGVYDNTADSWFLDSDDRSSRLDVEFDNLIYRELAEWRDRIKARYGLDDLDISRRYDLPQYHPDFRDPFDNRHRALIDRIAAMARAVPSQDYSLIVINGGKPQSWKAPFTLALPLLAEVLGIAKVASVMYNNFTRSRLRDLRDRFERSLPTGAVVDIEEGPIDRAEDANDRKYDGVPAVLVRRV
jgi:hypothetical protein